MDDARSASILSRGTLLLHLLLAKSIQLTMSWTVTVAMWSIQYPVRCVRYRTWGQLQQNLGLGLTTISIVSEHIYTRLYDGDKSKDDLIYTYTQRVGMNSLHGITDNENIVFHVFALSL